MKILLYGHNGSGNHGCEAIVRSTYKILNEVENNIDIILASGNINEDAFYKIDDIVTLVNEKNNVPKLSIPYIKAYLSLKLLKNDLLSEELCYRKTFNHLSKDTIAFSIGGDNYCYPGYQRFMMLHDMLYRKNIKVVLWGCSVEPSQIDKEMKEDLCKYNLIVARESLTFECLKKIGANVFLYPDPAFQLNMIEGDLPKIFIENKTVGINISPMIMNKESRKGITIENYKNLIEYILSNTDLNVALIPHVIWKDNNDDRIPLKQLYDFFKSTQRVCMLDDMSCEKLKWYISKCKYFIGARTHATIAAYSTYVPTLVVGYSIKAKGIAKDIFGTYENYVIPVQSLTTQDELIKGFQFIEKNTDFMRNAEKRYMTENIQNEKIKKILGENL